MLRRNKQTVQSSSLSKAAEKNPTFYLSISKLYKQNGQNAESRNALEKAEVAFRRTFRSDQLDHNGRVAFANVLALLEKYDEAEKYLLQGRRVKPDQFITRSLADFYAMRYDVARRKQADAQTQMDFLTLAIETDPDYSAVYSRMIQLFMEAKESPEQAKKNSESLSRNCYRKQPNRASSFCALQHFMD